MRRTQYQQRLIYKQYEARRWYEDHGGSLAAYVKRYGSATDPDHYGDGGEAIHEADLNAMKVAEQRVVFVTP